jgi:ribose-phosphate pyrophosphokinase
MAEIALFSLNWGRPFGERVAARLGLPLAEHQEVEFEWGEHKARPLESVRKKDVFVVQSLNGDAEHSANDKLCRLLFFLGALRDAAASSVTAVVPYLCYSRKERKTKSRDPVTTRYVAAMLEAVGVDRVVVLEAHSLAAFQNAFRCRTEHLEAHAVLADHFAGRLETREVVVVSPDVGGVKRADRFRELLAKRLGREVPGAFVEKRRSGGVVSGEALIGDVAGRTVLLVDDLVAGGTTLARAAGICARAGATDVQGAVVHGLFVPSASSKLADAPLSRLAVLDHVPPHALAREVVDAKLSLVDASGLIAEAIRRMHDGGSLVELLES